MAGKMSKICPTRQKKISKSHIVLTFLPAAPTSLTMIINSTKKPIGMPHAIEVPQFMKISAISAHPLNAKIYDNIADDNLARSVEENGILEPLVVTPEGLLISGHRRLAAAVSAGLCEVPVVVRAMAEDQQLHMILEYNTQRRKTIIEQLREYRAHLKIESDRAAKRMRHDPVEKLPQAQRGKARDLAAKRVGISGRSAESGLRVLEEMEVRKVSGQNSGVEEVERALSRSIAMGMRVATAHGWFGSGDPEDPEMECWLERCAWECPAAGAADPNLEERMIKAFLQITRVIQSTLRVGNAQKEKFLGHLLLMGLNWSFENYYGEPPIGRRKK